MRFSIFLFLACVAAVSARPQEQDIDNDIIPREPQSSLKPIDIDSLSEASSSTTVTVSSSTVKPEKATPATKPQDFLSRLIDDIIQIPIAALRAVNQLLNNITLRNNAAQSTTTAAPANRNIKF